MKRKVESALECVLRTTGRPPCPFLALFARMKALSSRFSSQEASAPGLVLVRKTAEYCAHCGVRLHCGEWFRYEYAHLNWEERTTRASNQPRRAEPRPACDPCRKVAAQRASAAAAAIRSRNQARRAVRGLLVGGLVVTAVGGAALGLLRILGKL